MQDRHVDMPYPQSAYTFGSEFTEVAYTFRQICSIAKTTSDKLITLSAHNKLLHDLFDDKSKTRFLRRIPITFNIPQLDQDMNFEFAPMVAPEEGDHMRDLGLSEWKVRTPNKEIILWRWQGMLEVYPISNPVYILRKEDLKSLYRTLIALKKIQDSIIQLPVLPKGVLAEIYDNSIGFLLRGKGNRDVYRKHNIPYKRGILLSGAPGCGKTLTCKWLRSLCKKEGLVSKVITTEQFKSSAARGMIHNLFRLPKGQCGLIFFDDMDMMVKDRKTGESNGPLQIFLTNLDGIDPTEGAVYIFTTNVIEDLDEAFVRPGRIDLFMTFRPPNAKMRKKFILERFSEEILKQVDSESILTKTNDYTFAELDEVRKLLTLDWLDGKEVSLERTFKIFELHRTEFKERAAFGFNKMEESSPEEDFDYEFFGEVPWPPMPPI